jgi:hypothetical protein
MQSVSRIYLCVVENKQNYFQQNCRIFWFEFFFLIILNELTLNV